MGKYYSPSVEWDIFKGHLKARNPKTAFRVLLQNIRFELFYALGGFTSASNYKPGEKDE